MSRPPGASLYARSAVSIVLATSSISRHTCNNQIRPNIFNQIVENFLLCVPVARSLQKQDLGRLTATALLWTVQNLQVRIQASKVRSASVSGWQRHNSEGTHPSYRLGMVPPAVLRWGQKSSHYVRIPYLPLPQQPAHSACLCAAKTKRTHTNLGVPGSTKCYLPFSGNLQS